MNSRILRFFIIISHFLFLNFVLVSELKTASPQGKLVEKIIPVAEDRSFSPSREEAAILNQPAGLAIAEETIYVLDNGDGCLRLFDLRGNYLTSIGRSGKGPGEFNKPEGMSLDAENNRIVVADTENRRIQILDSDGRFKKSLTLLFPPVGAAVISDRLYILAFPANTLIMKKEPTNQSLRR